MKRVIVGFYTRLKLPRHMRYGKYSKYFTEMEWKIENIVFSIQEYTETYILKS